MNGIWRCNTTGIIDDLIDETLREKLFKNELDHFFHNLWFGDMYKLLQVC